MDISERLLRLMKAYAGDTFNAVNRIIESGQDFLDEHLDRWEAKFDDQEDFSYDNGEHSEDEEQSEKSASATQPQWVEDLQLFGLTPPSSLEEVRRVRNREMKKFHPDKYQGQPEKMETAKQIVQIYNTAYDRLKKHYEQSGRT